MSKKPAESSLATNTRRRAADRRARAESSSSVESDGIDATVVRRAKSNTTSFVHLRHPDSDPPRRSPPSRTDDTTLLIPQTSNSQSDAPLKFDARCTAATNESSDGSVNHAKSQSSIRLEVSRSSVSNRLGRLERSHVDRGDREHTEPQSETSAALLAINSRC